jgi:hypothetical protein
LLCLTIPPTQNNHTLIHPSFENVSSFNGIIYTFKFSFECKMTIISFSRIYSFSWNKKYIFWNSLPRYSSMIIYSLIIIFYFIFFSKQFVSGIQDLTEILACNQLQNATITTGLVIGFAKRWLYSHHLTRHRIMSVSSRSSLELPNTSRRYTLVKITIRYIDLRFCAIPSHMGCIYINI